MCWDIVESYRSDVIEINNEIMGLSHRDLSTVDILGADEDFLAS